MSQAPDQDLFYDVDRDIIAPLRTPPLVAVQPVYESQDSPPPLVRLDPSSDSSDAEDSDGPTTSSRKPRKRKGRTEPTFADGVLIRSLDPNQGDLASHAERHALESAGESELDEDDNEAEAEPRTEQMRRPHYVIQNGTPASVPPTELAKAALNAIDDDKDDWPMVDHPASPTEEGMPKSQPKTDIEVIKAETPSPILGSSQAQGRASQMSTSRKQFNTIPPPLTGGLNLKLEPKPERKLENNEEEVDSIIKSPALSKFAIDARDAPPDSILPALHQRSPPRSSPAGSPDHRQTLPNIKTAITNFDTGLTAMSSMMGRPSPGHLGLYGSPASYSAMSPPGPPSHYTHYNWRSNARDSNNSTSSEYTSSSATASTPASSLMGASPASTQPILPATPLDHDINHPSTDSGKDHDSSTHNEANLQEGFDDPARFAPGSYTCTHSDCNAAPFQTQYLLNSHMNVHSNTRTHFCPVKGCARGPGGQGFKRKNEMIRHGLVHTSPGYICPFCPDQQHRYPRPDNLQRHVKQHHTEKDRDDPTLRDVLNQRMEGGNRGGRRRMRL